MSASFFFLRSTVFTSWGQPEGNTPTEAKTRKPGWNNRELVPWKPHTLSLYLFERFAEVDRGWDCGLEFKMCGGG